MFVYLYTYLKTPINLIIIKNYSAHMNKALLYEYDYEYNIFIKPVLFFENRFINNNI